MPTRAQKSLYVLSDSVLSSLFGKTWDELTPADMIVLSVSARVGHTSPNMAVLTYMVRKSRNVSQMEMGRNRTDESTDPLFTELTDFVRYQPVLDDKGNLVGKQHIWTVDNGQTVSGYFSLIAHIEQGKSQTVVPFGFMQYVAKLLNIDVSIVESAYAEDVKVRAAFTKSN